AGTLLADHVLVDLAGGDRVLARQAGVDEALVVAEVQVGLGAVVGDVDLAVLERAHGARIHVDVRVELHHRHAQAARLEDGRQGSRGNALAEGGHHAAGDENERGDGARGGHGIDRSLEIRILPVRRAPREPLAGKRASRTYDADRDGFVISGGGGILVVEEYEHAKARGARI